MFRHIQDLKGLGSLIRENEIQFGGWFAKAG
jgi:hypothetical protein